MTVARIENEMSSEIDLFNCPDLNWSDYKYEETSLVVNDFLLEQGREFSDEMLRECPCCKRKNWRHLFVLEQLTDWVSRFPSRTTYFDLLCPLCATRWLTQEEFDEALKFAKPYGEESFESEIKNRKPLHWIYGADEGLSYCRECCEKEVAKLKAENPDGDYSVDGGWGWESDSPEFCERCQCALEYSPTNECLSYELEYYESLEDMEEIGPFLYWVNYHNLFYTTWRNDRKTDVRLHNLVRRFLEQSV